MSSNQPQDHPITGTGHGARIKARPVRGRKSSICWGLGWRWHTDGRHLSATARLLSVRLLRSAAQTPWVLPRI